MTVDNIKYIETLLKLIASGKFLVFSNPKGNSERQAQYLTIDPARIKQTNISNVQAINDALSKVGDVYSAFEDDEWNIIEDEVNQIMDEFNNYLDRIN